MNDVLSPSEFIENDFNSYSFAPVVFLEILRTFGAGLMGSAVSNHLLLELDYEDHIGSLVSSMYFFGFLFFTLIFGHASDKYGRKKVILVVEILAVALGIFYLIPIRNNLSLGFFAFWRFLDGGMNGIFWPTIQSYSIFAGKSGPKRKEEFIKGYNFGWNFGLVLGMVGGALLVYVTGSNYLVFYFNLIVVSAGLMVTIIFLKEVPAAIDVSHLPISQENEVEGGQDVQPDSGKLVKTFGTLPMYTIIIMLLIHAFYDGGILIFAPIKVNSLLRGSFWVFIIGLLKAIAQTFSTVLFSGYSNEKVVFRLKIATFCLALTWLSMVFTRSLWHVVVLAALSGFIQGTIYACCMKLTSFKAQYESSSRPYSFYQATMGTGRMIGQIVIGFGTIIALNSGIWALLIYDLVAMVYFAYRTRGLNNLGHRNKMKK